MGSVGPNYRCPLCGRTGQGGYIVDGIPFPVCTEGDYACLWHHLVTNTVGGQGYVGRTTGDIWYRALNAVFTNRLDERCPLDHTRTNILEYLFGKDAGPFF